MLAYHKGMWRAECVAKRHSASTLPSMEEMLWQWREYFVSVGQGLFGSGRKQNFLITDLKWQHPTFSVCCVELLNLKCDWSWWIVEPMAWWLISSWKANNVAGGDGTAHRRWDSRVVCRVKYFINSLLYPNNKASWLRRQSGWPVIWRLSVLSLAPSKDIDKCPWARHWRLSASCCVISG